MPAPSSSPGPAAGRPPGAQPAWILGRIGARRTWVFRQHCQAHVLRRNETRSLHPSREQGGAGPSSAPSSSASRAASAYPPAAAATGKEERIRVVIRARPLERKRSVSAWQVDPASGSVSFDPARNTKFAASFYSNTDALDRPLPIQQIESPGKRGKAPPAPIPPTAYRFDSVHSPESTSYEIYHQSIRGVVQSALEGVHGTVFAYGQTGSGKTFTIVGRKSAPGLLVLAAEDLFEQVAGTGTVIRVGMLELYNEELIDLLAEVPAKPGALKIKEDPVLGVRVAGLREELVRDAQGVKMLLERGMSRRVVGTTRMNDISSRSHTIFHFTIETQGAEPGGATRVSTLNFVDLAGSERLDKSGNEGLRAQESAQASRTHTTASDLARPKRYEPAASTPLFPRCLQINLSLLMLGNVISKLSEAGAKAGSGEPGFIPYRNSKARQSWLWERALGCVARRSVRLLPYLAAHEDPAAVSRGKRPRGDDCHRVPVRRARRGDIVDPPVRGPGRQRAEPDCHQRARVRRDALAPLQDRSRGTRPAASGAAVERPGHGERAAPHQGRIGALAVCGVHS